MKITELSRQIPRTIDVKYLPRSDIWKATFQDVSFKKGEKLISGVDFVGLGKDPNEALQDHVDRIKGLTMYSEVLDMEDLRYKGKITKIPIELTI